MTFEGRQILYRVEIRVASEFAVAVARELEFSGRA